MFSESVAGNMRGWDEAKERASTPFCELHTHAVKRRAEFSWKNESRKERQEEAEWLD